MLPGPHIRFVSFKANFSIFWIIEELYLVSGAEEDIQHMVVSVFESWIEEKIQLEIVCSNVVNITFCL